MPNDVGQYSQHSSFLEVLIASSQSYFKCQICRHESTFSPKTEELAMSTGQRLQQMSMNITLLDRHILYYHHQQDYFVTTFRLEKRGVAIIRHTTGAECSSGAIVLYRMMMVE